MFTDWTQLKSWLPDLAFEAATPVFRWLFSSSFGRKRPIKINDLLDRLVA
jgi:hypothetical protein